MKIQERDRSISVNLGVTKNNWDVIRRKYFILERKSMSDLKKKKKKLPLMIQE